LTAYGFDFVVDRMDRAYTQSWREFECHWPWTTPLRIQEYCEYHGIPIRTHAWNQGHAHCLWYPIGLGFFDFEIDYLDLIPKQVAFRAMNQELRLLFWYHEGDNPRRIKDRLDLLCDQHNWPRDCYRFVTGNTAGRQLAQFHYFGDFEFWYYQRNQDTAPVSPQCWPRSREFTVLCRQQKPWRAAVMADLRRHGVLDHSYWSYCQVGELSDIDGPIQVDLIPGLRQARSDFESHAPYFCDSIDNAQRNNHALTVIEHHSNSWCNIVLESEMDVDQSDGVFLTEKTFKPIKHGQLFFIIGAAHSLAELRHMGYRTFDHVLDNSYDQEPDATRRWQMALQSIIDARRQGLDKLFQSCLEDILHNQRLFMSGQQQRLLKFLEEINDSGQ
jgi:hypothetical protein